MSSSRGANDAEAGNSSATGDPSAPPCFKKCKLTIPQNDLAKEWDITIEEVRKIMIENNTNIQDKRKKLEKKNISPLTCSDSYFY